MTATVATVNSFAGIGGNAAAGCEGNLTGLLSSDMPQGCRLMDCKGSWSLRLMSFNAHVSETLLVMLRDATNSSNANDDTHCRRLTSYDEGAAKDASLAEDIDMGIAALDALARKLTQRRYKEISERALRRGLISQLKDHPLMKRLCI
jgi:hypothetical protein